MSASGTIDICTRVRFDTLRVRLPSLPFDDRSPDALRAAGFVVLPKKRKAYYRLPVGEGYLALGVGRSKAGGTAIEVAGKSWRHLAPVDQISTFGSMLFRLLPIVGDVPFSVPRVDWAVQVPEREGLREEVLAVAEAIGFRPAWRDDQMTAVLGVALTDYRHFERQHRVGSVCRAHRLMLRCYPATTPSGGVVRRIEVQESVTGRLMLPSVPILPTPVTSALLASFGRLEFRSVEAPAAPAAPKRSGLQEAKVALSYLERAAASGEFDNSELRRLAIEFCEVTALPLDSARHPCLAFGVQIPLDGTVQAGAPF